MYADTITGSMQRAIDETNRRRKLQTEYNKKNGIVPKTITKDIRSIIQTYVQDVNEDTQAYSSADTLEEQIANLTLLMTKAAQELEFEKAAKYRDEITRIKKQNDME